MSNPIGAPKDVAAGTSQVVTGTGLVKLARLVPAAASCTCVLYDNAAGDTTGTVLARLAAGASGVADDTDGIQIPFYKGVTAVVTGAGATAQVYL